MNEFIKIKGAYEHNLKNIDIDIPRNKITVVAGVSGSGKSSLILNTLKTESLRQLFDIMGNQEQLRKPKVESITGLSPAVSIDQYITNRNPRSTVGTYTDVFKYIRWLYSQVGQIKCENCSCLSKHYSTSIYSDENDENAYKLNPNVCANCNCELKRYRMSDFSFNTPNGACKKCHGLGITYTANMQTVIDENLSIQEGAIKYWGKNETKYCLSAMESAGRYYGFKFYKDEKIKDYDEDTKAFLYYGYFDRRFVKFFSDKKPPERRESGFNGFVTDLVHIYENSPNPEENENLSYIISDECGECQGSRLSNELWAVTVNGVTINEINKYPLDKLNSWLSDYKSAIINTQEAVVVSEIFDILMNKVNSLIFLGLEYLSLNRSVITLSFGEKQRIRIANLLGSSLTGMIYIFDEPTIGLHSNDTHIIMTAMKMIKEQGNTVIIIEHDTEIIQQADYIVEIGPGAGSKGGELLFAGSFDQFEQSNQSIIKDYLIPQTPDKINEKTSHGKSIKLNKAEKHNLKNIDVEIKLNKKNIITGVSGSGKSTLIFDELLNRMENPEKFPPEKRIIGAENFGNIYCMSQKAINKSYRSNLATYTGIFSEIRKIFEMQPESKTIGLGKNHFSFNVKGGRCENCAGIGTVEVNMVLMPPLEIKCPECRGKRFMEDVLKVKYKGFDISEILNMTCEDAYDLFENKMIKSVLNIICEIGLGYLTLGQNLKQLSGGESQRLKMIKELSSNKKGNSLFIFDEPTTGLHPKDITNMNIIIDKLVSLGHTIIIIEHNLDMILTGDHIIDIGLGGGGIKGGNLIYQGNLKGLIENPISLTGKSLRNYLNIEINA